MANARAKKKAKSGSKAKSKKPVAARGRVVAKPKKAAKKVTRKPAPKKKAAAPKKKAKPAPVAKKKVAAPKPTKKPAAVKKALHPTVKSALEKADVEGLISRLPPPMQLIVKSLRSLVLESAPEASETLDDGAPSYFANGVFARIVPSERAVLLKFLKAASLPSAAELEGDSLPITELNEVKESVLRKLVREAVLLNLTTPAAAQV